jgi:hypothetical protein
MIPWKVAVIPPVLISGHPCGALPSAPMSKNWEIVVDEVTKFFGNDRVIPVSGAQQFAVPHQPEFEPGASVHFNEQDHGIFGMRMCDFLVKEPQLKHLFTATK